MPRALTAPRPPPHMGAAAVAKAGRFALPGHTMQGGDFGTVTAVLPTRELEPPDPVGAERPGQDPIRATRPGGWRGGTAAHGRRCERARPQPTVTSNVNRRRRTSSPTPWQSRGAGIGGEHQVRDAGVGHGPSRPCRRGSRTSSRTRCPAPPGQRRRDTPRGPGARPDYSASTWPPEPSGRAVGRPEAPTRDVSRTLLSAGQASPWRRPGRLYGRLVVDRPARTRAGTAGPGVRAGMAPDSSAITEGTRFRDRSSASGPWPGRSTAGCTACWAGPAAPGPSEPDGRRPALGQLQLLLDAVGRAPGTRSRSGGTARRTPSSGG